MVDIHSHIVFGVDDGAKTIEESLAMLRIAADAGTTDIVATPHADFRFCFDLGLINRRIAELQAAIGDQIRIHRGCDFHLHPDNVRLCLADRSRFTINGKGYLLVELPQTSIPNTVPLIFDEMMQRGITPVITHPERNPLLMSNESRLVEWVRRGCLIQVTSQSFTGRFGKSAQAACRRLIGLNLAHFAASDAHDTERRPPTMCEAYRHVESEYGTLVAERLFRIHPRLTLTGDYMERQRLPPKRSWYQW
jgi:protein-tyrosine phosphatase